MPDRYGEEQPHRCRNPNCHRGWCGTDSEDRPVPCLDCKPHLARTRTDIYDTAERPVSARAQEAIEREAEENP